MYNPVYVRGKELVNLPLAIIFRNSPPHFIKLPP